LHFKPVDGCHACTAFITGFVSIPVVVVVFLVCETPFDNVTKLACGRTLKCVAFARVLLDKSCVIAISKRFCYALGWTHSYLRRSKLVDMVLAVIVNGIITASWQYHGFTVTPFLCRYDVYIGNIAKHFWHTAR
tara:strand:+ start:878 stop:1279 length:402 start_codon:yes stop_codon:yes gene_type:complete